MAGPGGIGRWLPLQESACRRRSYAAPEQRAALASSCSLAEVSAGDAIGVPGLQAIAGTGISGGQQPASAVLMWGKIPPCGGVPRTSPPASTAEKTPRLLSPVGPSISTRQQGEAVPATAAASPRRVSQQQRCRQQQLDPAAADAIHDHPLPVLSTVAGDSVQATAQGMHFRCHGSVAALIEQGLVMAADLRVRVCACALSLRQSYVPPSRRILISLTMCINVCSTMCTPTTPSRHFHLRIHSGR